MTYPTAYRKQYYEKYTGSQAGPGKVVPYPVDRLPDKYRAGRQYAKRSPYKRFKASRRVLPSPHRIYPYPIGPQKTLGNILDSIKPVRRLVRGNPVVNVALDVINIIELLEQTEQAPYVLGSTGSWQLLESCANPNFGPNENGPDIVHIRTNFKKNPGPLGYACLDGQAASSAALNRIWDTYVDPNNWNTMIRGRRNFGPLNRYQDVEVWWRPTTAWEPLPSLKKRLLPKPLTDPEYWNNPGKYPPGVIYDPNPNYRGEPITETVPHPERSYVGPSPVSRVRPIPRPSGKRPGKRTKERKVNSNTLIRFLDGAIGYVTESVDAIVAVYYALPSEYRKRGATPQEMAKAIYRHYDKIDIETALGNLIVNQVTDRIYGTIGNAAGKAARNQYNSGYGGPHGNLPIGYQSGLAL